MGRLTMTKLDAMSIAPIKLKCTSPYAATAQPAAVSTTALMTAVVGVSSRASHRPIMVVTGKEALLISMKATVR